jgi:hypothetical protein
LRFNNEGFEGKSKYTSICFHIAAARELAGFPESGKRHPSLTASGFESFMTQILFDRKRFYFFQEEQLCQFKSIIALLPGKNCRKLSCCTMWFAEIVSTLGDHSPFCKKKIPVYRMAI